MIEVNDCAVIRRGLLFTLSFPLCDDADKAAATSAAC